MIFTEKKKLLEMIEITLNDIVKSFLNKTALLNLLTELQCIKVKR